MGRGKAGQTRERQKKVPNMSQPSEGPNSSSKGPETQAQPLGDQKKNTFFFYFIYGK
jgi:hypothetical protein